MGRPKGSRNAGYEQKKRELLHTLIARVIEPDGAQISFRELASAASVSVPTLRHYFGTRQELYLAVFNEMTNLGAYHLQRAQTDGIGTLEESLTWYFTEFLLGWKDYGSGPMVAVGLQTGLNEAAIGPGFVNELLEPLLQSLEARLLVHQERGELQPTPVRYAALSLISPVVMALLHQGPLGGAGCRPLDIDDFVAQHIKHFVEGFGVSAGTDDVPLALGA